MRIAEAQLVRAAGELQKEGVVAGLSLASAFGRFLRRKRLGRRAGKILRALDAYVESESGIIAVTATSARPLSLAERKQVEASAAALLGKAGHQVAIEFREDPTVIGGLRLETSDTRYDSTVARGLRELHTSLI